jgi:hypothetical protein
VRLSRNSACRLGAALAFFNCGMNFAAQAQADPAERPDVAYHLVPAAGLSRYGADQIALLEKLNRADRRHLPGLRTLIAPNRWDLDQRAYSPMPQSVPRLSDEPKSVIVDLATQVFGAYEFGELVRWGPVSSGASQHRTPAGLYHLNWNSRLRVSSENPDWIMPWYFNFDARSGFGLHQYTLPGRPASHGCVRLLLTDAKWLFHWGQGWTMTADGAVLRQGTPVRIIGSYNFAAGRPWARPQWWIKGVTLPAEVVPKPIPTITPIAAKPDVRNSQPGTNSLPHTE